MPQPAIAYADDEKWPYVAGFSNSPSIVEGPVGCTVVGTIPNWIRGQLYRVGPGIFDVPTANGSHYPINHWFDGLTVVHCFDVNANNNADGKPPKESQVTYRSNYSAQETSKAYAGGSQPFIQFSADPCLTLLGKSMSFFHQLAVEPLLKLVAPKWLAPKQYPQNIGVTVTPRFLLQTDRHPVPEQVLALKTDGTSIQPLDRETLQPLQQVNYAHINKLFRGIMGAAHEEFDPLTGSYYNFGVDVGASGCQLNLFEINAANPRGVLIHALPLPDGATYIHSMFSTSKYIIVPVYPVEIGWQGLRIMFERGVLEAMTFNHDKPTLFHVISRQSHQLVGTYTAPPMFVFHSVNAYDDGDDVVLDMCAYADISVIHQLQLKTLRASGKAAMDSKFDFGYFCRYRLPKVTGYAEPQKKRREAVKEFHVDSMPFELPRINERLRHSSAYQFVYAIAFVNRTQHQHNFADAIVKFDIRTHQYTQWSQVGHTPSEPIFIERPGAKQEDDGVLLSVVLDGAAKKSYLLCLDARTMKELGRADAPTVVTFGFHGAFDPVQ